MHVNDFDFDAAEKGWPCGICGDRDNHMDLPHGQATGDGLTRADIIDYLDGRGFQHVAPEFFEVNDFCFRDCIECARLDREDVANGMTQGEAVAGGLTLAISALGRKDQP